MRWVVLLRPCRISISVSEMSRSLATPCMRRRPEPKGGCARGAGGVDGDGGDSGGEALGVDVDDDGDAFGAGTFGGVDDGDAFDGRAVDDDAGSGDALDEAVDGDSDVALGAGAFGDGGGGHGSVS